MANGVPGSGINFGLCSVWVRWIACEKIHKRLVFRVIMAAQPGGSRPPSSTDEGPTPWALAGLGFQWFVSVLLFVYVGNWIDRRFHSAPVGLLVGVFVGGGVVFYLSVRRLLAIGSRRHGTPGSSPSSHQSEHPPDGD